MQHSKVGRGPCSVLSQHAGAALLGCINSGTHSPGSFSLGVSGHLLQLTLVLEGLVIFSGKLGLNGQQDAHELLGICRFYAFSLHPQKKQIISSVISS